MNSKTCIVDNQSITISSPESSDIVEDPKAPAKELLYSIDDTPAWYLTILLGFQHYLTMFGSTVSIPLIVTNLMCFGDDLVSKSEVIGTIFFVSGLVTLLQSTFGVRLPVVQGGTFAFLAPTIAILSLEKWQCPGPAATIEEQREIWKPRMREIQGAIIISSLFQVVVGWFGIIGTLLRFLGPITIATTVSLIGLTLFETAGRFCGDQWWIAIMTMVLITVFSQYLRDVKIPAIDFSRKGVHIKRYPFFKMLPVVFGMVISWVICYILTKTDVFPNDPQKWGYFARTDIKQAVLDDTKWFRFPYPFQWGLPTISVAAVFGMISGVIASMIESLGDYYAAARLSGAPAPPVHAINRGILMEGIGCILDGIWGTGNGTTTYSQNVGALGITKVGSRRVIQSSAFIMIIFGVVSKLGAFFVTIPQPIFGALFFIVFGTVFAVGVSNLQYCDLNSGRNIYIYGFSILVGLGLPSWMAANPNAISTGSENLDQVLTVLCSTSMFIGGVLAALLDNTVPGTLEERGMLLWQQTHTHDVVQAESQSTYSTYDFPCGMNIVRRWTWLKYLPICPTFIGCCTYMSNDDTTIPTPLQNDDSNPSQM